MKEGVSIPALNTGIASAKEWGTTADLEAITGISRSSWNKRRMTGDSPPFAKIGRSVRYNLVAARAWIAEQQRQST